MGQHQKGTANLRGLVSPLKDDPILTVPKVPQQSRHCITCILVLHNRVFSDGKTASIVTASTDGFVRAWSIHYSLGPAVSLDSFTLVPSKNSIFFIFIFEQIFSLFYVFFLCFFDLAHEFDSFITTMYTDEQNELLFTGDTRGYVKVWLLCEWMQAPEHLENHRHYFDPRNFPFIKRYAKKRDFYRFSEWD